MFTTHNDVMRYLEDLGLFHMDLTLDRVRLALNHLQLARPPYVMVQVVGTNGKGSTATFVDALARCHGLRTGLFTSPHFVSPSERIRIDGQPLPDECWPELARRVHEANAQLTYFEFLTVLAVLAFAEAGVDLAVLEAGLGGRWDATSAVHAHVLCLTPISMDHENVLGNTLTAIATDKAESMRQDQPVLYAPQEPEVMQVLHAVARQRCARLISAHSSVQLPPGLSLGLAGPHQQTNALLALACWHHMAASRGWSRSPEAEQAALRQAFIPGRFQRIRSKDPHLPADMLLDGAHNVHGMHSLAVALAAGGISPSLIIFSCLKDKDTAQMLPLLREVAKGVPVLVPTIADNSRAASGQALAEALGSGAQAVPGLEQALELALVQCRTPITASVHCAAAGAEGSTLASRPVLLCGSLYLLAEFFTLYPQFLTAPVESEAS